MFKFQPHSDAHIFLQIQENMFLEGGYLTREEFSSTFGSGHLFANPVQLMKSKSFRHRFMVVVVVPVVVLVVLMLMELLVVSRLSKCSHRGGYLTMFKFPPHSDARIFLQIQENMFL